LSNQEGNWPWLLFTSEPYSVVARGVLVFIGRRIYSVEQRVLLEFRDS